MTVKTAVTGTETPTANASSFAQPQLGGGGKEGQLEGVGLGGWVGAEE